MPRGGPERGQRRGVAVRERHERIQTAKPRGKFQIGGIAIAKGHEFVPRSAKRADGARGAFARDQRLRHRTRGDRQIIAGAQHRLV